MIASNYAKRPALQQVSASQLNINNTKFHIFEDPPSKIKVKATKPPIPVAQNQKSSSNSQYLEGIIKLQVMEIKFLRKKCAFLSLVNAIRQSNNNNQHEKEEATNKSVITPKKRRLEKQDVTEEENDENQSDTFFNTTASTPSRFTSSNRPTGISNNIPSTPVSILKHTAAYNASHANRMKENTINTASVPSSSSILRQYATSSPPTSPHKQQQQHLRTPARENSNNNPKQPQPQPQQQQQTDKPSSRVAPLTDKLKAVEEGLLRSQKENMNSNVTMKTDTKDNTTLPTESLSELKTPTKNSTSRNTATHATSAPVPTTTTTTNNMSDNTASSANTAASTASTRVLNSQNASIAVPILLSESHTLHDVITRATNSSMKTLLRDRNYDKYALQSPSANKENKNDSNSSGRVSTTPVHDMLLVYQSNNIKITTQDKAYLASHLRTATTVTGLQSPYYDSNNSGSRSSGASKEKTNEYSEISAVCLEASLVNYHHTTSVLTPLSPLGDQGLSTHTAAVAHDRPNSKHSKVDDVLSSSRSDRSSPSVVVPLSSLTMLQSKMSSWKDKYKS